MEHSCRFSLLAADNPRSPPLTGPAEKNQCSSADTESASAVFVALETASALWSSARLVTCTCYVAVSAFRNATRWEKVMFYVARTLHGNR